MQFTTDILLASIKNPNSASRFLNAVRTIEEGMNDMVVYNTEFNDAKERISRVVDEAWKFYVSEPFFYAGKWQELSAEDINVYDINVYGLHDTISASKKVAKLKHYSVLMTTVRNLLAECLPISLAVKELKPKVIKGRKPSGRVAEVNPDKVVKTCPCCLRQIAVRGGTMVHHGYERTGHGYTIGSCPAVNRFKPLEESSEGALYMIDQFKMILARASNTLAVADDLNEISRTFRDGSKETYRRGDAKFGMEIFHHKSSLESTIRHAQHDIDLFEKTVVEFDAKR